MEDEMNSTEKHRHLRNRIKTMSIEISNKLKHLIPKGGGRVKKHFNINEFATHLRNSDFIMDGKEKREILQVTENLISSNAGHLEISAEINYSGPHTTNRTTSNDESQDFP